MGNESKAIELRCKGLTYELIGIELGISRQRVHQLLTGYRSPSYKRSKRLYNKQFRETDIGRRKHREMQARFRNKVKYAVVTHYGNSRAACIRCGFDDIRALSIDHINGGGSAHTEALGMRGGAFYKWLIANTFPEGFQTLCMNCQMIKRFTNNEWYRLGNRRSPSSSLCTWTGDLPEKLPGVD